MLKLHLNTYIENMKETVSVELVTSLLCHLCWTKKSSPILRLVYSISSTTVSGGTIILKLKVEICRDWKKCNDSVSELEESAEIIRKYHCNHQNLWWLSTFTEAGLLCKTKLNTVNSLNRTMCNDWKMTQIATFIWRTKWDPH